MYDYAAYYETTSEGIDYARLVNRVGTVADLLSKALIIDATTGSVFSYNGTTTLTIKASALADGVTFTALTTAAAVTYSNGATFNTIITSSAGTTARFAITGLSSHNIYVQNATPAQVDYQTGVSSYVLWINAGETGAWRWRAVKYGNVPETGTFTLTNGGRFTAALSNVADANISQTTLSTVLAYTTLENWDKVYDYSQAYLTTSAGKALGQFATKNGAAVDLGSYAVVVDATAPAVFALASGITIKATTMGTGAMFNGAVTSSTITTANSAIINTWYTSSAGRSVLITAPNIVSGSRYQLYNNTTATEINNAVSSSNGVYFRLLWTSDATVRLRVTYQAGVTAKQDLVTIGVLTSTGLTFLDAQQDESVYNANAIDGSSVTELSTDYANIRISLDDPDGVTSVQRIYAWYHYIVTTADGIRNFFGGMTANDTANYSIVAGVVNLKLYNQNVAPVIIVGGYLSRSDGVTVISATSNSIQMDPSKAYVAAGGGSLTSTQAAQLAKLDTIEPLVKLIPAAV